MSNFVQVLAFQPSILNMVWPNYLASLFFRKWRIWVPFDANLGSRYRRCFDLYSRWKNRRNQRWFS
jgi:hypothetical protein